MVLLRDSVVALLRQVASVVFGLAALAVVANRLGPEGFASFIIGFVAAQVTVLVLSGSVPSYLIREISRTSGSEQTSASSDARTYTHTVLWIAALLGLLYVGAMLSWPALPGELVGAMLLLVLATLGNELLGSILSGSGRIVQSEVAAIVHSAFVPVLLLLPNDIQTVGQVLIAYGLAACTGVVGRLWLIHRYQLNNLIRPERGKVSDLYLRSFSLFLANIAVLSAYRAHYALVALATSPAALGVFALAQQVGERAWIPAQALASVLFPRLSALNASQLREHAAKVHRAAAAAVALALSAVLSVALLPRSVFVGIFGEGFDELPSMLMQAAVGIGSWAGVKVYAAALASQGLFKANLWISICGLVFTLGAMALILVAAGPGYIAAGLSVGYGLSLIVALCSFDRLVK